MAPELDDYPIDRLSPSSCAPLLRRRTSSKSSWTSGLWRWPRLAWRTATWPASARSRSSSPGSWGVESGRPSLMTLTISWVRLRAERRLQRVTIATKAQSLARFFDFLIRRYQGDIHALTGVVVTQPIDEFNSPAKGDHGAGRVPPPEEDVLTLFARWREALPGTRKYLPARVTTWPPLCGDGPDCG